VATSVVNLYCVYLDFPKVKFIYSQKATEFCEIFPLLLSTVHTDKSKGEILQKILVFSEYMNFKCIFWIHATWTKLFDMHTYLTNLSFYTDLLLLWVFIFLYISVKFAGGRPENDIYFSWLTLVMLFEV
jgi:hypothetical protein